MLHWQQAEIKPIQVFNFFIQLMFILLHFAILGLL